MNVDQFRKAINLGLGRVILYLRNHLWKPHAQAIEHVCLHNTAYDPQCEGSRAEYVYEIVRLTYNPQHFADIVVAGLLQSHAHWDTDHLFDLAGLFAKNGFTGVREAMYEKFRQDNAAERFIGAEQIVSLDGNSGLLFVVDRIGKSLEANPDYWVDDALIHEYSDGTGKGAEKVVREAAITNPNIRRYVESVDKWRVPQARETPDYRSFSYAELRKRILDKNGDVPRMWVSGWGKNASDDALREAAQDLLKEHNEKLLLAYLHIFHFSPFPLNPHRLIELAKTNDEDIARASRRALRHIRDDSVRTLGLELIDQNETVSDGVRLLVKNYADNDHLLIESLLAKQSNEDDFHWSAHAAIDVFKTNPTAQALSSMLEIYERCRCSLCRKGLVKLLMERRNIPAWMLAECLRDSYDETRKVANEYIP